MVSNSTLSSNQHRFGKNIDPKTLPAPDMHIEEHERGRSRTVRQLADKIDTKKEIELAESSRKKYCMDTLAKRSLSLLEIPPKTELLHSSNGLLALHNLSRYDHLKIVLPNDTQAVQEASPFVVEHLKLLVYCCPKTRLRWISGRIIGAPDSQEPHRWALKPSQRQGSLWDNKDLVKQLSPFVFFDEIKQ